MSNNGHLSQESTQYSSPYQETPLLSNSDPMEQDSSRMRLRDSKATPSSSKTQPEAVRTNQMAAISLHDLVDLTLNDEISRQQMRLFEHYGPGADRTEFELSRRVFSSQDIIDEEYQPWRYPVQEPRMVFQPLQTNSSLDRKRKREPEAPRLAPPVLILYEYQPGSSVARYLPLTILTGMPQQPPCYWPMLPDSATETMSPSTIIWPADRVPVEVFQTITSHLTRDDVKALRLVNKDFAFKVSNTFFETVVVPFNAELYDMVEEGQGSKVGYNGKDGLTDPWQAKSIDEYERVYKGHGLAVFSGFGPHIRRYGMSFDLSEDVLSNPPAKKELDKQKSYFGSYAWPPEEYQRFEELAGLERTVEERHRMVAAFSNLTRTTQLALSMDDRMGWLSGPDVSLHGQIFPRQWPVFRDDPLQSCISSIKGVNPVNHLGHDSRDQLWAFLQMTHNSPKAHTAFMQGSLHHFQLENSLESVNGIVGTRYADTNNWYKLNSKLVPESIRKEVDQVQYSQDTVSRKGKGKALATASRMGVLSMLPLGSSDPANVVSATPFMPNHLDKRQLVWLREAHWTQNAFLQTYMLGIVDNPSMFNRVTSLTLTKFSVCFLKEMGRKDFWTTLSSLQELTLHVIPAFRTIEVNDAGDLHDSKISPSKSANDVYAFLINTVSTNHTIRKLNIGWSDGGEGAAGLISRNSNLLPAPLTTLDKATKTRLRELNVVRLPYVEHLTLTNCWISPPALIELVETLEEQSLQHLNLDSVSLSANPFDRRPTHFAQQGGGDLAAANNIGQAAVAPAGGRVAASYTGSLIANNAALAWATTFLEGPPPAQPLTQWANTMLAEMRQWMTANGIAEENLAQLVGGPLLERGAFANMHRHLVDVSENYGLGASNSPPVGTRETPPSQNTLEAWNQLQQERTDAMRRAQRRRDPFYQPYPGGAPSNRNPSPTPGWYDDLDEGCWPEVLDQISPGITLAHYKPIPEHGESPTARKTQLESITLTSCGYVRLDHQGLRATEFEYIGDRERYGLWKEKVDMLKRVMLTPTDGRIVQWMDEREQDALRFAWGCRMGWDDEAAAKAVEFDGLLPGGTGRFSGCLRKGDAVNAGAVMR